MILQRLEPQFSVCKLASIQGIASWDADFVFLCKTDEELSLICESDMLPADVLAVEEGYRGMRLQGELDFALIGVLAKVSSALAEVGISLLAVSTYNTDYFFVKERVFDRAAEIVAAVVRDLDGVVQKG